MEVLRIGIVAGESSGDILGASLISSLKKQYPDLVVEGIGGPRMIEAGCSSFHAMENLSVMGLLEPLKRLPTLLRIRKHLKNYFVSNPPDVFIGIDSPDFTLPIEFYLKQRGIKTVHYVSPSVWAWRQGRIHKIKKSVDHMLTLFPFEKEIYQQHNIPVTFVGHPIADDFPLECDVLAFRQELGLDPQKKYLALLPGSRENEIALLGFLFVQVARSCRQAMQDLHFLVPAANPARKQQLQSILDGEGITDEFPLTLFDGQSHQVMGASDAVLMASGTTTLEALLLKKPMVVTYKMGTLSYAIISRMLKSPYVSLPNLLAGRQLVPELIQDNATVERISEALLKILDDNQPELAELKAEYRSIHESLRCDAGSRAAQTVLAVTGRSA